jgi:hypothetical protein
MSKGTPFPKKTRLLIRNIKNETFCAENNDNVDETSNVVMVVMCTVTQFIEIFIVFSDFTCTIHYTKFCVYLCFHRTVWRNIKNETFCAENNDNVDETSNVVELLGIAKNLSTGTDHRPSGNVGGECIQCKLCNNDFVSDLQDGNALTNTNLIVFGLTWSRLEPTIYCTRSEHANHYTIDAVTKPGKWTVVYMVYTQTVVSVR